MRHKHKLQTFIDEKQHERLGFLVFPSFLQILSQTETCGGKINIMETHAYLWLPERGDAYLGNLRFLPEVN